MKLKKIAFISIFYISLIFSGPSVTAQAIDISDTLATKRSVADYIFDYDAQYLKKSIEDKFFFDGEYRNYNTGNGNDWKFYLFISLISLIVLVRVNYHNDLQDIITSFFNFNLANQIYRDRETTASSFSFVLLNLNSLLVFSIIVLEFFKFLQINFIFLEIELWGIILGGVAIFFIGRIILLKIISKIFSFGKKIKVYLFHIGILYKILGLALLPMAIFLTFIPDIYQKHIFIITIAIILAFICFRYIRGLLVAKTYLRFYRFHFFLYICTLEIAPVLIVIKIIQLQLF